MKVSFVLLALATLFGCQRSFSPYPAKSKPPQTNPAREAERQRESNLPRGRNLPALAFDVESYHLRATFDWRREMLLAEVEIKFKVLTAGLSELVLSSNVAKVVGVSHSSGSPLSHSVLADAKLKVSLPNPLAAGAIETVRVAYEASANQLADGAPAGLIAVPARKGDPSSARVVYTTAEPLSAAEWMPCQLDTRDRAVFSVSLTLDQNETAIANGALVDDSVDAQAGKRYVRYETAYPLPVYLMAFAQGDFVSTEKKLGNLPVSIWHRRGVPIRAKELVDMVSTQISYFQTLLGPFPFEKYAVVLLPEFSAAGLEHASITFQAEQGSSLADNSNDHNLYAHELGHQWFGDYMTIEDWDDLWIKEGMATLLGEEASRKFEDQNRSGRLFGNHFHPNDGDAIRDPSLVPDEKYTSGPYDRAAWFYSQLRSLVGEKVFWSTLRQVLKDHAFSNIGTQELLNYFKPLVPADTWAKLPDALAAKKLPQLLAKKEASGGGALLTVEDPDSALITPPVWEWRGPKPTDVVRLTLTEAPTQLLRGPGQLGLLDPSDTHPISSWLEGGNEAIELLRLMEPETENDLILMRDFPGSGWQNALHPDALPLLTPQNVFDWLKNSPSDHARASVVAGYCRVGASAISIGQDLKTWQAPLAKAIGAIPNFALSWLPARTGLAVCAKLFDQGSSTAALAAIARDPAKETLAEENLLRLALLPTAATTSAEAWYAGATQGASVRARMISVTAWLRHFTGTAPYEKLAAAPSATELAKAAQLLLATNVSEVQGPIAAALANSTSVDVLQAIAESVATSVRPLYQVRATCAVYRATDEGKLSEWKPFQSAVLGHSPLRPFLQALVEQPEVHCNSARY